MTTTTHPICNICNRPTNAPWRRLDAAGSIVEGCVDAAHTGPILSGADLAWHLRPEAERIRARMALCDICGRPQDDHEEVMVEGPHGEEYLVWDCPSTPLPHPPRRVDAVWTQVLGCGSDPHSRLADEDDEPCGWEGPVRVTSGMLANGRWWTYTGGCGHRWEASDEEAWALPGEDEPEPDDQDRAEMRLMARDYEAWASL